jgi:hypothetical protein
MSHQTLGELPPASFSGKFSCSFPLVITPGTDGDRPAVPRDEAEDNLVTGRDTPSVSESSEPSSRFPAEIRGPS